MQKEIGCEKMKWNKIIAILGMTSLMMGLCGCAVNQAPEATADVEEPRLIATSYATVQIFDLLDIDLIARAETARELSPKYAELPVVGTAMAPDAEAMLMMGPTNVIGPDTLIAEIQPKYDAAGLPYTFIDLQSIEGLYESVTMIGNQYGKAEEAAEIVAEYEQSMEEFYASIADVESPRVLVLMGLPGAYIGCTTNSYAGSLVEMAGATNVIQVDTEENFVSWNTEELMALDPDMILLTAHALPDMVMDMFADEFATNDIWKNFRAVEEGQVYALDYNTFGMSATFNWTEAFDSLTEIFYEGTYESFINEENGYEW